MNLLDHDVARRGTSPGHPCQDFAASMRRPGGLIAAPLDPLLAFLCSVRSACRLTPMLRFPRSSPLSPTVCHMAVTLPGNHAGSMSAPVSPCPFSQETYA